MDKLKLIERLDLEGKNTVSFFEHLDGKSWTTPIYSEQETWTVHQILAHFVSVERAFQWLVQDIISGGTGAPEDFDLNRFNRDQVRALENQSSEDLLSTFLTERAETIKRAAHFDDEDLLKVGNHPWFGELSIAAILRLLYQHNMLHIRDIRRTISNHT